jgi:UV DNA damage repair endonuclease
MKYRQKGGAAPPHHDHAALPIVTANHHHGCKSITQQHQHVCSTRTPITELVSSWYTKQWASWIRGGLMEESSDAHVVVIQQILEFLGEFDGEDISFLLKECFLHVEDI